MDDLVWIGVKSTVIRYNHSSYSWVARVTGSDAWAISRDHYRVLSNITIVAIGASILF